MIWPLIALGYGAYRMRQETKRRHEKEDRNKKRVKDYEKESKKSYEKHAKEGKKEFKKFDKKGRKEYAKYEKENRKDYEQHVAQSRKDYKKYSEEAVHPFHGLKGKERKKMEKKYYSAVDKAMKGKHIKYERMSEAQRDLLKSLSKQTRKDIEHMPQVKDVTKPTDTAEFKAGSRALQDILGGSSEEGFRKYKEGAMSDFKESVLPSIAERFAGSSSAGIKSSAFQNSMIDAAKMLETHLASQKEGMRVQNEQLRLSATGPAMQYSQMPISQAANMREMAMAGMPNALAADRYMQGYIPPTIPGLPGMPQPFSIGGYNRPSPYQTSQYQLPAPYLGNAPQLRAAGPGALHNFLGAVAPALGAGVGTALGGPIGGAIGSGIGGGLSNMFSGGGGGYQQPMASGGMMPPLPQNFGARAPAFNPQYSMRYPGL